MCFSCFRQKHDDTAAATFTKFQKNCLEKHNVYRKNHSVDELMLNKGLCAYAQQYAESLAKDDKVPEKRKTRYGENIYVAKSENVTGESVVTAWYEVIRHHDSGFPPTSYTSTQVLWKVSKNLGIGIACTNWGGAYVVAIYDPPGNIIGKFDSNVPLKLVIEDHKKEKQSIKIKLPQPKPSEQYKENVLQPFDLLNVKAPYTDKTSQLSNAQLRIVDQFASSVQISPSQCNATLTIISQNDKSAPEKPPRIRANSMTLPSQQLMDQSPSKRSYNSLNEEQTSSSKLTKAKKSSSKLKDSSYEKLTLQQYEHELIPLSAEEISKWETNCLRAHNYYRQRHNVGPLELNKSMCEYAQEWAQYMGTKHTVRARPNNKYGESRGWHASTKVAASTMIRIWYDEVEKYDFQYGTYSMDTRRFRQVVWKGSKELGIGVAKTKTGGTYLVANYYPPGDDITELVENIFPPNESD